MKTYYFKDFDSAHSFWTTEVRMQNLSCTARYLSCLFDKSVIINCIFKNGKLIDSFYKPITIPSEFTSVEDQFRYMKNVNFQ